MLLYKYARPERVDILTSRCIRFTQPADLNDPFDVLPRFPVSNHLSDPLLDRVDHDLESILSSSNGGERLRDAVAMLAARAPLVPGASRQDNEVLLRGFVSLLRSRDRLWSGLGIQKRSGDDIGVLCMSAIPDSLLMWAHYADSHRGFVIEFDGDHEFFRSGGDRPFLGVAQAVQYQMDRLSYPALHNLSQDDYMDYLTQLLLTKSQQWSYEQEWRMLVPLDDLTDYPHQVTGRNHLFELPPETIRSVIIGNRCERPARSVLIAAIRSDPRLAHVRIDYAHIHPEQYALTVSNSAWPTFPPD